MTSERSSNQPSPDVELAALNHDGDDESTLATLLCDAMDSPPVPRSLIKRLDAEITQQWGHSPELVRSRSSRAGRLGSAVLGNASLSHAASWAKRSWWLTASIAATLMLVVFISGGSSAYAWAAVVEAMQRQGVIQISGTDSSRWLDLSEQIACQQDGQQSRWIDFRQRTILTHPGRTSFESSTPSNGRTERSSLVLDNGFSPTQDELLALILLDQPLTAESIQRFRGVRVVEQEWQPRTDQGRSIVDLRVRFATKDGQQFALSLQLDPESKLPISVKAGEKPDSKQKTSLLTYLDESTTELQSRLLPANTSEDSNPGVAASSSIAITNSTTASKIGDNTDLAAGGSNGDADDKSPQMAIDDHANAATVAKKDAQSVAVSLPIGAANKWKPVTVIPRSDQQTITRVDSILDELWSDKQLQPVDLATDLELVRRVYLDLAGRTPTVTEVRSYSKDNSNDRYRQLVDRLLDSPDYTSQMAAVWRSFLIPEGVDLDAFGGREAFEKWLTERFAKGEPYDKIVRQLLLAEGRLSQSGPLLFYSALKLDADQLAARTSRVFLGMRLECAQCHDHPFEPWSQQDFWSYAAFFAQISRPKATLENVSTVMQVRDVDRGEVMLPESDSVVPPRFLGESFQAADASDPLPPRRQQLANWLTGPDNPYFARATVNRVWSHLFGRGIVDPVDDFGENNRPVSPELLDTLASQFIESGFDLKRLVRTIALSRAYRLSSSSPRNDDSPDRTEQRLTTFAQMNVKTLTPEQLYDCIAVATLLDQSNATATNYTLARFGNSQRDSFLQQFAAPTTSRSEYLAGIPQALMLMNGSLISQATGEQSSGLIRSLDAPFFTDQQRIEVLFMATLSRPPSPQEREAVAEFIPADATTAQRHAGMADLLWALINSSEFTLNH